MANIISRSIFTFHFSRVDNTKYRLRIGVDSIKCSALLKVSRAVLKLEFILIISV